VGAILAQLNGLLAVTKKWDCRKEVPMEWGLTQKVLCCHGNGIFTQKSLRFPGNFRLFTNFSNMSRQQVPLKCILLPQIVGTRITVAVFKYTAEVAGFKAAIPGGRFGPQSENRICFLPGSQHDIRGTSCRTVFPGDEDTSDTNLVHFSEIRHGCTSLPPLFHRRQLIF